MSLGRPENFDLHWMTTNINEKDVVYGASDKLKYAIEEAAHRYSPKAIFILTPCATGIIGEDVEGAVNEVQPYIKARIVPVHCEGVRSRLAQTGYDAFWHGVLKYLVKKTGEKTEGSGQCCQYALLHMAGPAGDHQASEQNWSAAQLRARVRNC